MVKLFELNKNVPTLHAGKSDTKIIFYETPHVQYKQLKLQDLYKQYLGTNIISKTTFQTGLKPSVFEKTYELHFYVQSHIVDFTAANRQFDWLVDVQY